MWREQYGRAYKGCTVRKRFARGYLMKRFGFAKPPCRASRVTLGSSSALRACWRDAPFSFDAILLKERCSDGRVRMLVERAFDAFLHRAVRVGQLFGQDLARHLGVVAVGQVNERELCLCCAAVG